MTQEVFDKLVEDGIELQSYNDQYETASFLQNLANKYNLIFNEKDYMKRSYHQNLLIVLV